MLLNGTHLKVFFLKEKEVSSVDIKRKEKKRKEKKRK